MIRAYTIQISKTTPQRFWTGYGTLTYGGHHWAGGGHALGFSGLELVAGNPDRRSVLTIAGIDPTLRADFLQDVGPVPVIVQWIYSDDGGATWTDAPVRFVGRISTCKGSEGQFEMEVETLKGDVLRGRPEKISHEDQQRRFKNDRGLEYMRALSQKGFDSGWPP